MKLPLIVGILEILAGSWMLANAFLTLYLTFGFATRPLEAWYFLWPLFIGLIGILPVVGGLCALKRRRWRLAFDGALGTLLVPLPLLLLNLFYMLSWWFAACLLLLPIAIIILIVLSKREFT